MGAPRREGEWYVWDTPDGGAWRSRAWRDPRGHIQTPVAPGIYLDDEGHGHVNVPELCRMVELEATYENLERVAQTVETAAFLQGLRYAGRLD